MIEEQNVSMILIILYLAVKDIIVPLIKKVTNGGKDNAQDLWKKVNEIAKDVAETKTSVAVIQTKLEYMKKRK